MKPFSTPVKPPGQTGTSNIELDYLRRKLSQREEQYRKHVVSIERTWQRREKAEKSLTRLTSNLAKMEKERVRLNRRIEQAKRFIEAEEAKRKEEPIAQPEPPAPTFKEVHDAVVSIPQDDDSKGVSAPKPKRQRKTRKPVVDALSESDIPRLSAALSFGTKPTEAEISAAEQKRNRMRAMGFRPTKR